VVREQAAEIIMNIGSAANSDQVALWNGVAGHAWVEAQEVLDRMFKPFENLLTEFVAAESADRVLDIGCGTGTTTLAAARSLGASGRSVGIDISEPMIALARTRAERDRLRATFIEGDAQSHAFEPASFDAIISRFGVMFFDDSVGAFTHLRRAARDGARLRCVVWRSAAENPFMTTAERAAAPLLPDLPARRPDAPGQFAFADERRVSGILKESGWSDVDITPVDVVCTFSERDLVLYLTRLGSVGVILERTEEPLRSRVIETLRIAFEPFVHGTEVRFNAACWVVSARALTGSKQGKNNVESLTDAK
jgi:SAM-dependent methyltransferase